MMNSDDASNSNNNPSNVEAEKAVEAATKTAASALKDFTSKIVATIGNEGTQYGCLVSEAMRLFDKDWREGFTSHMSKLGCDEPLELLKKVASDKINVFLDQQNRWRVVIVKNEANKQVLGFIDAEIYRRKNGIKRGRSVNIIPLRNQDNYDRLRRGQISFAEAAAVAAAVANAGVPGGMPGTSASPLPVRRPTYTPSAPRSSSSHASTPPRPSPSKTPPSSSTNGRSRFANSPPTSARARPNFFRQPSRSPRSPRVSQPQVHVVQKQPVVKQQQQLASVNYGFQQKSGQDPIHGIGTSTFQQQQYVDLDEPLRTTDELLRTPRRSTTPTQRLSTSPPSLPEEQEGHGQGGRLVFDPKTNGFYTRLFSKDHWEQVEAEAKRKIKSEKEQLALPQQQPNSLNSSSGISSLNSSLTNRLAAMDISTDDAVGKKNNDDVKEEEEESANAVEDGVPDVPMAAAAAADISVNESLLAPLPDDDDELMEEEEDW